MRFLATLLAALGCADRPLDLPEVDLPRDFAVAGVDPPDLSQPDLSQPDLSQPDLAHPDLALPDLLPPPGLRLALRPDHACARIPDGRVECWGANDHGQLGDGTTVSRLEPSPVPGLSEVLDVAAGDGYSCALERGGKVSCWGVNDRGQLGDGTTSEHHSPAPIALDGAPVQLAAGSKFACALLADGELTCWGSDNIGEMGDGTCSQNRLAPAAHAQGISSATQLSLGYDEACARLEDGTLRCWGEDLYLGIGVEPSSAPSIAADSQRCGWLCSTIPLEPDLSGVVEVAMNHDYGCALTSGATVECWGLDLNGSLGNQPGQDYGQLPPISVLLPPVLHVGALGDQVTTFAQLTDGTVMVWGGNGSPNPATVFKADVFDGLVVTCSTSGCCGLRSDGGLTCLGAPSTQGPL